MVVFIAAILGIADFIKNFLVENFVEILTEMPRFNYSMENGIESGSILFNTFKSQRDVVIIPLIVIGSIAYILTGRFGHKVTAVLGGERTRPVDQVHDIMRRHGEFLKIQERDTIILGGEPRSSSLRFGDFDLWAWVSSLPSKCALCIILLFIFPVIWDAATDGSAWAAAKILNPLYSGDKEYPCPAHWYMIQDYNIILDTSGMEYQDARMEHQYLLVHADPSDFEAVCKPDMRVRYMLEQWGGQTKAIPPPIDTTGSFWVMLTSMGQNASDWIMRGLGEFFINIMLGMIKAQAVIMSGIMMVVSNVIVDVGVATMIIFMPFFFLMGLIPWRDIHLGNVQAVISKFAPGMLLAALVYPLEIAILFAISSEMMTTMLLTEFGNDLVIVWLFVTSIVAMVVAIPVVSLGAFSDVAGMVTGKFTIMIQTAQGGVGAFKRTGGASGVAGSLRTSRDR